MLLSAQGISKSYAGDQHRETVLRDLHFDLKENELVAIFGPSGSGKSTLLHLLAGLDRPDQGAIFFRGRDITQFSDAQLAKFRRDDIGVVFQFFNLFPALTVLENISLPGILSGKKSQEVRRRSEELAEQVGLSHRLEHRASELSGGEMQRAALCRALLNRPPLILADEPTGNLDSSNRGQVNRLLKDLQAKEGVTLVIVTHDASISKLADREITLRDGRIEACSA